MDYNILPHKAIDSTERTIVHEFCSDSLDEASIQISSPPRAFGQLHASIIELIRTVVSKICLLCSGKIQRVSLLDSSHLDSMTMCVISFRVGRVITFFGQTRGRVTVFSAGNWGRA